LNSLSDVTPENMALVNCIILRIAMRPAEREAGMIRCFFFAMSIKQNELDVKGGINNIGVFVVESKRDEGLKA
jgi:hypothetical protein